MQIIIIVTDQPMIHY